MEIITGYVGKPHVTSEQDRDVHIGMIGSGSYVLQTGKQMAAEISSNNEIKVRDGVLMHQGCAASIKKNTYDSLSIVNGSQGMKRIDLIVARYERNENTGVESLTLKVLKGTPASANPATPAYTTGDIQAGDYIADMPMYKVTLDGINITKLEKQFQTVETNATLTQKVNELNSTLLKKVEWTSEKMSFDVSQARNLGGLYKPTVEGYTALACLGGQCNGAASMICNPNGWVYNASGLKYSSVSVTYQWLFIKNL